jgi:N utilization substance protein A
VRLAAKLLGWRVDIKSEEEKRREVETEMVALQASGAPVAVLIDYGLTEDVADRLVQAGIDTVEKVGSMTPEQLEEIPGIDPETVADIQIVVTSYYAQFEEAAGLPAEEPGEEAVLAEEAAEGAGAAEAVPPEAVASEPAVLEAVEAPADGESDTMEDAGSSIPKEV